MNAKDSILNNYKVLSKPSKAVADIVLGKSEAKEISRSLFKKYDASRFQLKICFINWLEAARQFFYNDDVYIALERVNYFTLQYVLIYFSYNGMSKELLLAVEETKKNKTSIVAVIRKLVSP